MSGEVEREVAQMCNSSSVLVCKCACVYLCAPVCKCACADLPPSPSLV